MSTAPMSDATPATDATAPRTVESIEADAAKVRDDLAETIDELTHRLDVPARAKEKVSDLGERTTAAARQAAAKLPAPVRYLQPAQGGVSHFRYGRDNALLTWMYLRLFLGLLARR